MIRLMMVLKLLLLGRGAFELRRQICTPTSTNQEGHASMVAYGGCRLQRGCKICLLFSWLRACVHAFKRTNWHIERLYSGLLEDVITVRMPIHRRGHEPDAAEIDRRR